MNNFSKSYTTDEGRKETVVASSNDNYNIKLKGNYKLANHNTKKLKKIFRNLLFSRLYPQIRRSRFKNFKLLL